MASMLPHSYLSCSVICSLLLIASMKATSKLPPPPNPTTFSFKLHLHPHSLSTHQSASPSQPLVPHLFSGQPLFLINGSGASQQQAGNAQGLLLANPSQESSGMELRYLYFTASLAQSDNCQGTLALMGSLDTGFVSVVGGTGNFTFANGQAKVTIASSSMNLMAISFDVELQYENEHDENLTASI